MGMQVAADYVVQNGETPFSRFISEYAESKVAIMAFIGVSTIALIAVFAPWISPQNPYDLMQVTVLDNLTPPGGVGYTGASFVLGSDGQGRDLLSAIFYGLRLSLIVGLTSGLFAVLVGIVVGLTAAYVGGRVDSLIMRIVDLQLSFPPILVALILLAIAGRGVDKVIFAMVIVQWANYARNVRGIALVERRREYIEAAKCLSIGGRNTLFKHVLPNCMPPLIVIATVQVSSAISLEATLSFLGLGLPPTEPSLGLLIANGFDYMMSGQYWISFYPGIALLITVMCINLVGDQLRDVMNPRLRK